MNDDEERPASLSEEYAAMLAAVEPHEPICTQEEYEAGPDFAGIAERVEHMMNLTSDGWWGDYSCWVEAEAVMREFGPVYAAAAAACATEEDREDLPIAVMEAMEWFLNWHGGMEEDETAAALNDDARRALRTLRAHLEAKAEADKLRRDGQLN